MIEINLHSVDLLMGFSKTACQNEGTINPLNCTGIDDKKTLIGNTGFAELAETNLEGLVNAMQSEIVRAQSSDFYKELLDNITLEQ
ncbi:MAG: hypothetical protein IH840_01540 [Candidatus Heimdallarchaeota archaeon]|nr:hypothetical protein [Candidatus Heimdallarchaeota archaeon]